MSIAQIVLRTIVTTIDVLLSASVIKASDSTEGMKKAFTLIVILNLAAVWC